MCIRDRNRNREILFINNEALTVLNLKREEVIRRSAEELSLKLSLIHIWLRPIMVLASKDWATILTSGTILPAGR